MEETPETQAKSFLNIAAQYKLGELPTEQSHPLTQNLSQLSSDDLPKALAKLQEVDQLALTTLSGYSSRILALARDVSKTLEAGGRVFLCGCGATGRLALTLETLAREGHFGDALIDRVIGFMAGGDSALIRSLEGFEDFPEYGARQLNELGFQQQDMLIGITEGGETPFVIGATEAAAECGSQYVWFCYCNPAAILKPVAERSKRILGNNSIQKLGLFVGPMALAGSTRMQATTVQLLAVGLALQHFKNPEMIAQELGVFKSWLGDINYADIAPVTESEVQIYKTNGHILYQTLDFGMTVLTDTTERAPTFSLPPFENENDIDAPLSLCYLSLLGYDSALDAWSGLLQRQPRCLEWSEVKIAAGYDRLMGFDISRKAAIKREKRFGKAAEQFSIEWNGKLQLRLKQHALEFSLPENELLKNVALKVLLNAHSTLVMGKLGRFEGNLMTWVKPSNNKLIDRSIRYVRQLHESRHGNVLSYEETCLALFQSRKDLESDEAIVLKTLDLLGSKT